MGVLVWCGVCGGHYTRRGWGGFMTGMVEEGWSVGHVWVENS